MIISVARNFNLVSNFVSKPKAELFGSIRYFLYFLLKVRFSFVNFFFIKDLVRLCSEKNFFVESSVLFWEKILSWRLSSVLWKIFFWRFNSWTFFIIEGSVQFWKKKSGSVQISFIFNNYIKLNTLIDFNFKIKYLIKKI